MTFATQNRWGYNTGPQNTGWKTAGTLQTGGAPLWTNSATIRTVDGSSATVSFDGEDGSGSALVWLSAFDFALPATAVLDGLEVRLRGPANPDPTRGLYRAYIIEGATPSTPASVSQAPLGITSVSVAYDEILGNSSGGIESAWGLGQVTTSPFPLQPPLTVARVNDTGFGIAVDAYNTESSGTWYYILESAQARVHWHFP